jgi:hypothetical protein
MKSKKDIIRSDDAVSEVIGYSLILSIVIISVCVMAVSSYPIISNLKDTVFMETSLEALSMLDGRISMVAFGTTPSQPTRFDLNGGMMMAGNDSENRLTITVANISGEQIVIFDKSLGKIEYTVGDQKIGFENGGMFRKFPEGDTLMVSPPEFHFNGETLTFPIIRINSTASISGKGIININSVSRNRPVIIYPNVSSNTLVNPLYAKQLRIRLKSEYYKAWAQYIEERTEVVPLTNDLTHEVVVSLSSLPSDKMEPLVVPIEVMGLDPTNITPVKQFMFDLSNVDSNFHMILRAPKQISNDLVIEMQKSGGMGTAGLTIWINYNKNGYNESWKADTGALITSNITSINLLNSSALTNYDTNDLSGTWVNETSPYNRTYRKSGDKGPVPLNVVMQHYFKLVSDTGTFALYPGTNPEWPTGFEVTNSTYVFEYNIIPPNINYLHIVEHEVDVSFS